ncbi:poly(U)-binding-splicing factor PUF60-like [Paramacrobiotus metropolitanus]|uniref:poly(U)-binding-splicing factor PUF60-like n=1 Tax=Paramacrobiotus metropolitanus TaxID=2943436 RepID=UPI0024457CD6|nr:poly(U)-binding-splicing factor PUF60-like [Paramacrobiotus metropolitanus]
MEDLESGLQNGQAEQTGRILVGPGAKNDLPLLLSQNLIALSEDQKEKINKAKKYATEQSIKYVLMKQTLAHQQQQQKHLQRQQALMLMCRVYVGSISFELKEETIKTAFHPFGPIRSVNMSYDPILNKHKGFAFVEYEIPEAAQIALEQMGGAIIGGRNIKVGRPSNMPQAQPLVEEILAEAALGNRIYLASIHADIAEDDLKSVFEAFGKIVSVTLARISPTSRHKGYGYIEYENTQSAQDAIASMNMFDLGGMHMRVGKCIMPPNTTIQSMVLVPGGLPAASAVAAAAVTAKLQALEAVASPSSSSVRRPSPPPPPSVVIAPPGFTAAVPPPIGVVIPQKLGARKEENGINGDKQQAETKKETASNEDDIPQTLHHQENMVIKGSSARHLIMQKLVRPKDTSVIVLRNMVTPDEVDGALKAEIEEECSQYGAVKHVVIYQERENESPDAPTNVKIFVEFEGPHGADKAKAGLNGRYFAGRIVKADIYDRDLFEYQDYSG